MLDSGRLLPTDTGLSQLDGVPMFPLGLQEADGWSAPFDNPWSRCTVRADQTTGPEQYSCAVAPSMTTNGGLGHDRSGAESGGAGADLCIPSNLYHAQIAQNLEPRLGSLGPFNTIYTRNAEAIRLGGGEHRVNSEIWDRAQYGFDPRCAVYEGEGPGYTGNTCPWDANGLWNPVSSGFDSLADYLGLEPTGADPSCGANPHTGKRKLDLQAVVVGSVEIGGQYQAPGFPGRMAWNATQPSSVQDELLSLTWFGEATPPVCAVPYRTTMLRSPLLGVGAMTCDQCMFSGWDDPMACQTCLALTPPGQTETGALSPQAFPVDLAYDGAALAQSLSYGYDAAAWRVEMPPSLLDCRNYPVDANGDPDPSAASYHTLDSTGPMLETCASNPTAPGCGTALQDAFLCATTPAVAGKECVDLMGLNLQFNPADPDEHPSGVRRAYCPDQYGFDGAGLNYRWYLRPECPMHSASYPEFPPEVNPSGDLLGALLPYPSGTPPWSNPFDDFYFNGWNHGAGSTGLPDACVDIYGQPRSTLGCSVEEMKFLEYDLNGDGAITLPDEFLDNLIGMALPDEMGVPANRPYGTYLAPSYQVSPWLHGSCREETSGVPVWQDEPLCQEEGRAELDYKVQFRGAFWSEAERLSNVEQRDQIEEHFPAGDRPLVFAQDGDLQNLTDQVLPAADAPANAIQAQDYPFFRLTKAQRDSASTWIQAWVRPLTWSRDRTRAFADLMDEASAQTSPAETRPAWFSPQAIGEPPCNGCTHWDDGLGLNRARPTLEQMRAQAWMAIAEGIDGLIWFPDSCPGGHPCALDEQGWELAAHTGDSALRPGPMSLGEQILEVASELRIHNRVYVEKIRERDLTDNGELDPWELDRSGPRLDGTHYAPADIFPPYSGPTGSPVNVDAPGAPNFHPATNEPIDTDGDGLANEGRKQDASSAVFGNPWTSGHLIYSSPWLAGLHDNYLTVTNLKECRKYVATSDSGFAGLPVPPAYEPDLVDLVEDVNTEDGILQTLWYLPCNGNDQIAFPAMASELNYFFGPNPAGPLGAGDVAAWQGTGGLFAGVENEVTLGSASLHEGLVWCQSLSDEDGLLAQDLAPNWWTAGAWKPIPAADTGNGTVKIEFIGPEALAPYDTRICYQGPLQHYSPWSTPAPTPQAELAMFENGWAAPEWAFADPTVRSDPNEAEIVDMCLRPEGAGVEPCDHSFWDWLVPTAERSGFGLCTGCADESGQHVGGLVDEASDSWVWLQEPGSAFAEYDFSGMLDGTLCLELKHEYEPGHDAIGGAVQFDRASVQVVDAGGCHVLGHGAASNSCTTPITIQEPWALEEAAGGGTRADAIDLTAWLGMPFSVALRYEAWEDGVRTDGPGWEVEFAGLRWFNDETKSCEELLGWGPL